MDYDLRRSEQSLEFHRFRHCRAAIEVIGHRDDGKKQTDNADQRTARDHEVLRFVSRSEPRYEKCKGRERDYEPTGIESEFQA
jgi:hypothetical protein